jgi:hypothetical protein
MFDVENATKNTETLSLSSSNAKNSQKVAWWRLRCSNNPSWLHLVSGTSCYHNTASLYFMETELFVS